MKKLYVLILGMLFMSYMGKAQWVQLNDSLLRGANLQQLVQTSNGLTNSVIAITSGGLFQTANQGQTWTYIPSVDSVSNYPQNYAVMNNNLYIQKTNSINLLKYDDGTWTELNPNVPTNGWNSGLGGANNKLFTFYTNMNDSTWIYYSSDGSSWQKGMYLGEQSQGNTNIGYLNNSKQYFSFNDTLYSTTNGVTKTFVPFPTGYNANNFLNNGNIYGELNGKNIYYSDKNNAFFRFNTDTSKIWMNLTSNITTSGTMMIVQMAVSDSAIFADIVSQDLSSINLLRSTDYGNTFTNITIASCGLDMPILMQVISVSSDNLIAQDMSKNMFYSTDNGTTWTKGNNGLLAIPASNLCARNGTFYNWTGNGNGGGLSNIIKSTDNGNTWSLFNTGLPQLSTPGFKDSLVQPESLFNLNNELYVTAQPVATHNSPTYVYMLDTTNNKWVQTAAQPSPPPSQLTYLGTNNKTFFVLDNNNGDSIWRTTDGGQSWDNLTSSIHGLSLNQIYSVKGKGETDTLFLFGNNNNNGDKIYLSTNNGTNWSSFYTVNNGNIKLDNTNNNTNNNNNNGHAVCDFGGTNKTFIMLITHWNNNNYYSDQLYELKNGTLVQLNTTGLPDNLYANCIKYINSKWYLATTVGVYVSANGISWTPINNNSGYYLGMQTQQIYVIGQEMFIGTNTGIWKNDLAATVNNIAKSDNNIRIYPNPVNNILNIDLLTKINQSTVDIYSEVGEKVFSETSNSNNIKIDFSQFSKGLYLVRIQNGDEVYTKKIVK